MTAMRLIRQVVLLRNQLPVMGLDLREEEVHFDSDGHTLAGVLVLPTTPGPHPAVVFIHGSGPSIGMTGHCTPSCASSSPGRELLRYVGINRALERPAATGRGRVFAIGRRKRLTP